MAGSSLLLVTGTPVPGSCEKIVRTDSFVIKCYDPVPALTEIINGTKFRASLHRLLRKLPSAAAPTGFASLHTTRRNSAFVRGQCFGDAPVPSECLRCLAVAARNLTSGCGTATRRAGIWTDGCFVAFADTGYSLASEDAFRSRVLLGGHVAVPFPRAGVTFYSDYIHSRVVTVAQSVAKDVAFKISGARMLATADETRDDYDWPFTHVTVTSTVHVLGQCARDRTEVECSLCLMDSAKAVNWELDATRGDGGVAAAVVAFDCFLRFEVSSSLVPGTLNLMRFDEIGASWNRVRGNNTRNLERDSRSPSVQAFNRLFFLFSSLVSDH